MVPRPNSVVVSHLPSMPRVCCGVFCIDADCACVCSPHLSLHPDPRPRLPADLLIGLQGCQRGRSAGLHEKPERQLRRAAGPAAGHPPVHCGVAGVSLAASRAERTVCKLGLSMCFLAQKAIHGRCACCYRSACCHVVLLSTSNDGMPSSLIPSLCRHSRGSLRVLLHFHNLSSAACS